MEIVNSRILERLDFLGSLLFFIGSILFLRIETVQLGTWLFIIGSLLSMLRSLLTLIIKRSQAINE